MSFEAFVWAWRQPVANATDQHILLALANIAPIRETYASATYIAGITHRSERQVRRCLANLEGVGLITITDRPGRTDLIRLNIPPDFTVSMPPEGDLEAGKRGRPRKKTPDIERDNPGHPVVKPPPLVSDEPIDEPKVRTQAPDGASSARGTRLPEGWEPEPNIATLIGLTGAEAADQLDRFRDYWTAQPGSKGRKTDWPATWRNWCRTALERRNGRGSPASSLGPRAGSFGAAGERAAAYEAALVEGARQASVSRRRRWSV